MLMTTTLSILMLLIIISSNTPLQPLLLSDDFICELVEEDKWVCGDKLRELERERRLGDGIGHGDGVDREDEVDHEDGVGREDEVGPQCSTQQPILCFDHVTVPRKGTM